ncbi:hypothetical protein BP5796_12408 [Coleophoma crateriformis]|uniref:Extracellular serine-rich protein n=1 Tax=Coleophoma crateriformis TaxID=565419 RepID=A0A3D8QA38_9HELO|nr:hypothetical protein BP5796_12408 [Coleophoma crateriformis]
MVNAFNIINGILGFLGGGLTPSTTSSKTSSVAKTTSTSTTAKTTANALTSTTAKIATTGAVSSLISNSIASSVTSVSVNLTASNLAVATESVGRVNINVGASVAPSAISTKAVTINGTTVNTNTTVATNVTIAANVTTNILATSVNSTVLIITRDAGSAYHGYSGLNGYRIPYQVLLVPQTGATLPVLNSTSLSGNFGAIVVLSEVSYDYGTAGFNSALTADQWAALYAYQLAFGVRMVRLDVYPSSVSGTQAAISTDTQGPGCCGTSSDQTVFISNSSAFPTAGMLGGTLSTNGLYHYPAIITDTTIATEFAQFGPTTGYATATTAGVINNIAGRQQMVFFMPFAPEWSQTSSFLQHAWIHWVTRGLYSGFRRVYLGTQIDDMFLASGMYWPAGNTFRLRTTDLDGIKSWMGTLNTRLNPGSRYIMEVGHNGNGNIIQANTVNSSLCSGGPIQYSAQIATTLEFQKPLGSGASIWNPPAATYPYTTACTQLDTMLTWWTTPANRDVFAHVSHTFSHESENNATFSDINYEISWNQAWLKQTGLDQAKYFSPHGLIPPAITGLHNGDALRAWAANGLTSCVGDNTRPVLMNTQNEHWPYISNVNDNGYDGMQYTPRFATRIYYNCDSANCTVNEWIATSSGAGDIYTLLDLERTGSTKYLLSLRHDPYMFHQANLRNADVDAITINGQTNNLALISMWVETVVQELMRLVNWPIITLTHDDLSTSFANRMAADLCNPQMTYVTDPVGQTITGVTITTTGNTCTVPIPVTFPASVTDTKGFTTEKVGNDPLTIWVKMTGNPVSFTLSAPVPW